MPLVIRDELVSRGFFPKEIPPEFTSRSLSSNAARIVAAFDDAFVKGQRRTTEIQRFSLARREFERRTLGIPNPLFYVMQASCIADHWAEVEKLLTPRLSLSKPAFNDESSTRLRSGMSKRVETISELRLRHSSGRRFVLETDFAYFYPSLYTHAIPWAIHEKSVAKMSRGADLFGNALDNYVRSAQDGQTLGLPIGPDTSQVVAEIIASRIDAAVLESQPALSGFRYYDDYFLAFDLESDARAALDTITAVARSYELQINYNKTRIVPVGSTRLDDGIERLTRFELDPTTAISRRDVHAYFQLAESLNRSEEGALRYAVSSVGRTSVAESDWSVVESYLLRAVTLNQNSVEKVVQSFVRFSRTGLPLDLRRVHAFFEKLISDGLRARWQSEVLWSLWLFKHLGLRVNETLAEEILESSDSFAVIVLLDLVEEGLVDGSLDVARLASELDGESLYGGRWLLAYQASRNDWIPQVPGLRRNPLFELLEVSDVNFYNGALVRDALHSRGDRSGPQVAVTATPDADLTETIPEQNVAEADEDDVDDEVAQLNWMFY